MVLPSSQSLPACLSSLPDSLIQDDLRDSGGPCRYGLPDFDCPVKDDLADFNTPCQDAVQNCDSLCDDVIRDREGPH